MFNSYISHSPEGTCDSQAWPVGPFHGLAEDFGRRCQPQQQHLQRCGEALPGAAAGPVAERAEEQKRHGCGLFQGFFVDLPFGND